MQANLLISKPMSKIPAGGQAPLLKQLRSEVQQIAKDLGKPIKAGCVNTSRNGRYFRVVFLWLMGKPGQLFNQATDADPFSFLIRLAPQKPQLRLVRDTTQALALCWGP